MEKYAGGWLVTPDLADDPRYIRAGASMNRVDVTPDGRWVSFDVNSGQVVVNDGRMGTSAWEDHPEKLGR